mgnify:CR=1 FL=1
MPKKFLTAEWRKLIMVNYTVDPLLLQPYIPAGTEPDNLDVGQLAEHRGYVQLVAAVGSQARYGHDPRGTLAGEHAVHRVGGDGHQRRGPGRHSPRRGFNQG